MEVIFMGAAFFWFLLGAVIMWLYLNLRVGAAEAAAAEARRAEDQAQTLLRIAQDKYDLRLTEHQRMIETRFAMIEMRLARIDRHVRPLATVPEAHAVNE
jgi:biopolymer transport protein ExbB/TolQ